MKQAAVDPSTGKIDITILTTGISGAARKRRAEITQTLKKCIKDKGKVPTLKYQKLFEEFREGSDFVSFFSLPKHFFLTSLSEMRFINFYLNLWEIYIHTRIHTQL